jgi:hypothetical protein
MPFHAARTLTPLHQVDLPLHADGISHPVTSFAQASIMSRR